MTVSLLRDSRAHLADVGEHYLEHLRFATAVGSMLMSAGMACLLHGLVPALCRDTASRTIRLLAKVVDDRSRLSEAEAASVETGTFAFLCALSLALVAPFWIIAPGALFTIPVTLVAFAIPAVFLLTNPDLRTEAENEFAFG